MLGINSAPSSVKAAPSLATSSPRRMLVRNEPHQSRLRQLLLAFVIVAVPTLPVAAAERVALVIGNADYRHAPYLSNPVNDATAVAEQLAKLGFEVGEPLYNLDRAAMVQALRTFGRKARSAEAAIVYYAGHGMEAQGENYLLPVDARLEYEADVPLEALALSVMLNQIAGARNYRLVILDACRDNPLANQMRRRDGTRTVYRGLEPVEPTTQTYVAYAAKAGTRARDGSAKHSPFTAALLKYLPERLPLERLFGAVREEVLEQTGREQEPHLYGAFGRKPIYLAGGWPTPRHSHHLNEHRRIVSQQPTVGGHDLCRRGSLRRSPTEPKKSTCR